MCRYFYLNLIEAPFSIIYGVLFLLVAITAIIGNVLSIIILWKPTMTSKSNKILRSLAIADVLVGILSCPLYVYQLLTGNYLSDGIYEDIRHFFTVWLSSTSALSVVLLAIDRYFMMTKLTNYSLYISDNKLLILIVFTWLYPLLILTSCYVSFNVYRYGYILSTMCSTTTICVCYVLIIRELKKRRKNILLTTRTNHWQSFDRKKSNALEIQLARKVAFLVGCFILCNAPSFIVGTVRAIYQPTVITSSALQQAYLFAFFSASANSSINPIVYIAKYPEFQRQLKKMLRVYFSCFYQDLDEQPENRCEISLDKDLTTVGGIY